MSLSVSDVFNTLFVYIILGIAQFVWFIDRLTANVTRIFSIFLITSLSLAFFFIVKSELFVFLPYSLENHRSFSTVITSSKVLGAISVKEIKPYIKSEIVFPELTASSYLVVDRKTGKVLAEKNKNIRLASASTTKLMTALIAFDIYSPEDVVKVSKDCVEIDSTKVGFPQDSEYKAYDLITAMLIGSEGDAACALAEGKVDPDEFIYRMNQKAYLLGMKSTFFTNAVGLDGIDSSHFSTANDLFLLSQYAVKNSKLATIVRTKDYAIKSIDEGFIGKLENTNKLLWEIPQTVGIKTGKTVEAKEVLIYEYADDPKDLIIIVMGSDDRFSDTRALLFWTLASYEF